MRKNAPKARQGKTLLVALLAVMVVLAIAVVWLWRRPATQPDMEEGKQVAEQFLKQIRSGHPDQAWQSTTAEFKNAMGRDRFVAYLKDKPFLKKPLQFVSVQTVTVQKNPRTEYLYRAETGAKVRLLAGNENGAWHIDRLEVDGA